MKSLGILALLAASVFSQGVVVVPGGVGTVPGGTGGGTPSTAVYLTRATDQAGTDKYVRSTTGNDTYVGSVTPALTAYTAGGCFVLNGDTANTGAATININSLGAKSILTRAGGALSNGDITANAPITICYDGTQFIIQGDGGSGGGAVSSVTAGPSGSLVITPTTGAVISDGDSTYIPNKLGNNAFTGTNDFPAGATPGGSQSITAAGNTITCTTQVVQVTPTSTLMLTSAPSIAASTDGAQCEIWNLATAYSLVLLDKSVYPSTGIVAADRMAVIIPPQGSVTLKYSVSMSGWVQTNRTYFNAGAYSYFNDFCDLDQGWGIASIGPTTTTDGGWCAIEVEHNTTFGNGAAYQIPIRFTAALPFVTKARIKLQQSANTGFRFGTMSGNGVAAPTDGVYIEKLAADTTAFAVCNSGSTSTRTALPSMDGSYHTYSMVRTSTTSATFFMDTTSVTVATNCPADMTGYRNALQFGVSDATARSVWMDWFNQVGPR